jgi:hypothetical protein
MDKAFKDSVLDASLVKPAWPLVNGIMYIISIKKLLRLSTIAHRLALLLEACWLLLGLLG